MAKVDYEDTIRHAQYDTYLAGKCATDGVHDAATALATIAIARALVVIAAEMTGVNAEPMALQERDDAIELPF